MFRLAVGYTTQKSSENKKTQARLQNNVERMSKIFRLAVGYTTQKPYFKRGVMS